MYFAHLHCKCKFISFILIRDIMEVVSNPFFHILTYIQEISGLVKRRMGTWFISTVVDWMEADLNASLSIIRMG